MNPEKNISHGRFSIVCVGASAGGIECLSFLISKLPSTFSLSVVVVLHRRPDLDQLVVETFRPLSPLPIKEAEQREPIKPGYIYFAPSGYHLLIEADKTFSISTEEAVNFSRPSIDVLFESAADVYGAAAIGLILSGASEDGARGLQKLQEQGGLALVQEPTEADFPKMPVSAKEKVPLAMTMTLEALSQFLGGL